MYLSLPNLADFGITLLVLIGSSNLSPLSTICSVIYVMHPPEPIVHAYTWIGNRNQRWGSQFRLLLVGFDGVLSGEMTYMRIPAKASNYEQLPPSLDRMRGRHVLFHGMAVTAISFRSELGTRIYVIASACM